MSKKQNKPLFIYDGDCAFCRHYVFNWKERVGDKVDFKPYQKVHKSFSDTPLESFKKSSKLVLPSGKVLEAAEGIFTLFSYEEEKGSLIWWYNNVPLFGFISEIVYKIVSRNRPFFMMFIR